jgi:O-antigen ligase
MFEAFMVICFGISWPVSIVKSVKSRTVKGKSLVFILFVLCGYAFGIACKLISGTITYVFIFYVINFVMVAVDIGLYFRNSRLDRLREADAASSGT